MNTKTTKFLAVIAVLAIAFAAFAIVLPSEQSDAATTTTTTILEDKGTSAGAITAGYVSGEITYTVTTWGASSIVIAKNSSITFTIGDDSGDLKVYPVKSFNEKTKTATYDDTVYAEVTIAAKGGTGVTTVTVSSDENGVITYVKDARVTAIAATKMIKFNDEYVVSSFDVAGLEIALEDTKTAVIPASMEKTGKFSVQSNAADHSFEVEFNGLVTDQQITITAKTDAIGTLELAGNATWSTGTMKVLSGKIVTSAHTVTGVPMAFTGVADKDTSSTGANAILASSTTICADFSLGGVMYVIGNYEVTGNQTIVGEKQAIVDDLTTTGIPALGNDMDDAVPKYLVTGKVVSTIADNANVHSLYLDYNSSLTLTITTAKAKAITIYPIHTKTANAANWDVTGLTAQNIVITPTAATDNGKVLTISRDAGGFITASYTGTGDPVFSGLADTLDGKKCATWDLQTVHVGKYQKLTVAGGATLNLNCASESVILAIDANGTLDVWGGISGKNVKNYSAYIDNIADGNLIVRNGADLLSGITVDTTDGNAYDYPAVAEVKSISGEIKSDYVFENQMLADETTIAEGVTATVDGMLYLNNSKLIVNGTLKVPAGAKIGTSNVAATNAVNAIILGKNGVLEIEGTMAENFNIAIGTGENKLVVLNGIAGLDFGVKATKTTNYIVVSGTTEKITGLGENTITLNGAYVTDSLTIASGIEATISGASVKVDGGSLIVDGILNAGIAGAVSLESNGSVFDVQDGFVIGAVAFLTAKTGEDVVDTSLYTASTLQTGLATNRYSGFAVSMFSWTEEIDEETYYTQIIGIEGSLKDFAEVDGKWTQNKKANNVLIVAGTLYVFEGDEFAQTQYTQIGGAAAAHFVVEGTVTSDAAFDNAITEVGATYDNGATKDKVYYLAGLDVAMDALKTGLTKEIALHADATYTLELKSIELSGKVTINGDSAAGAVVIPEGETVSFAASVKFDGDAFKSIDGILVVYSEADCTPVSGSYDVVIESDDAMTYCGLMTAIVLSEAGDVITYVGTNTAETAIAALTVPADRKLVVEGTLFVEGALTVEADAELEITGALTNGKAGETAAKIVNAGNIDASTGKITMVAVSATKKAVLDNSGTVSMKTADVPVANFSVNGASYVNGSITTYTSLADALLSEKAVTLYSKVKDTENYVAAANLTINNGAALDCLSLTMANGKVLTATGAFTGILSCTVSSSTTSMVVDSFKGAVTAGKTMNVTDVSEAKSIALITGALNISDANGVFGDFHVGLGTTATLSGDALTVDTMAMLGELTISGTVTVTKEKVDALYISGDVTMGATATLNIGAERDNNYIRGFQILGNITGTAGAAINAFWNGLIGDVSGNEKVEDIAFDNVTFNLKNAAGKTPTVVLGANAIEGVTVTLVDKFTINLDIDDKTIAKAYSKGSAADTAKMIMDLADGEGVLTTDIFLDGTAAKANAANWYMGKTKLSEFTAPAAGTTYTFVYDADSVAATVKLSYNQTQISVYIGGIFVANNSELNAEPGIYALSIQLAPGYSGVTYATLDGEKVYDSFVVTEDMCDGKTHYLIGILVPETDYSDDVGISIEYTLDETALVSIYAFDGLSVPAGDIEITVYYWMMLPTGTWYLAEDITVEAEVEGEAVVYATEVSLYEAAAVDIAYLQVAYLSEDEEVAAISARIVAE